MKYLFPLLIFTSIYSNFFCYAEEIQENVYKSLLPSLVKFPQITEFEWSIEESQRSEELLSFEPLNTILSSSQLDESALYQSERKLLTYFALPQGYTYLESDFILNQNSENQDVSKGNIARIINSKKSEYPKDQLYREKVSFSLKGFEDKYKFLSFRFMSSKEDPVWAYSPYTESLRKLTASNRVDYLFGSLFALNDFFVWSQKSEDQKIVDYELRSNFIPYSLNKLVVKKNSNCLIMKHGEGQSTNQIVLQSAMLMKFLLINTDIYSEVGRQIIYFDALTKIPVYKFVYDRTGALKKAVFNIFAQSKEKNVHGVYQTYLFSKDGRGSEVSYLQQKMCKSIPQGESYSRFDPKRLSSIDS